MRNAGWGGLALSLLPMAASAQSSYIGPDRLNRYPAVTIFCPQGTGVVPCNFGGSGGGNLSISGTAVSLSNPLPMLDTSLTPLISNAHLSVAGSVSITGTPSVALAASNAIGTVGISNFPVIQPVSGTLAINSLPPLSTGSNSIGSVSVSNFPGTQTVSGAISQSGSWSMGVSSLPALSAGSNAIGSVSVSNFPVLCSTRHHGEKAKSA